MTRRNLNRLPIPPVQIEHGVPDLLPARGHARKVATFQDGQGTDRILLEHPDDLSAPRIAEAILEARRGLCLARLRARGLLNP